MIFTQHLTNDDYMIFSDKSEGLASVSCTIL
jgi:hypothetical protein